MVPTDEARATKGEKSLRKKPKLDNVPKTTKVTLHKEEERKKKRRRGNRERRKEEKAISKTRKSTRKEIGAQDSTSTDSKETTTSGRKTASGEVTKSTNTNWSAAATHLEGGDLRKSKFLRLLGASTATKYGGTHDSGDAIRRREQELKQHFEASVKIKNERTKRKGLGA